MTLLFAEDEPALLESEKSNLTAYLVKLVTSEPM